MPLPSMRSLNRRAGVDRFLRRVRRRNDLEQVQIPRRIEEVHAEEARPEGRRASLEEHRHRNARRVRRDDRVLGEQRLEPRVERALRLDLLDDRLDHEVAVGELARDRRRCCRSRSTDARDASMNAAGFDFSRALRVRRARSRCDRRRGAGTSSSDDRNSGRRRERRDAAAHRSRAYDPEFPNSHWLLFASYRAVALRVGVPSELNESLTAFRTDRPAARSTASRTSEVPACRSTA